MQGTPRRPPGLCVRLHQIHKLSLKFRRCRHYRLPTHTSAPAVARVTAYRPPSRNFATMPEPYRTTVTVSRTFFLIYIFFVNLRICVNVNTCGDNPMFTNAQDSRSGSRGRAAPSEPGRAVLATASSSAATAKLHGHLATAPSLTDAISQQPSRSFTITGDLLQAGL